MNLMQKLKRAGGKWLLSGDWSKLVELPLERRFSFRMRGREFLSLSVGEIKRLPADLLDGRGDPPAVQRVVARRGRLRRGCVRSVCDHVSNSPQGSSTESMWRQSLLWPASIRAG